MLFIIAILQAFVCLAIGAPGNSPRQCAFPTNKNLVPVTPDKLNGGWAMSPDQQCKPGSFCPYACPPGQVMTHWDKKSTKYAFPESMNGGLYCNQDGQIEMDDVPLCVDTKKTLRVDNKAKSGVAFCQTVLPGNEAMLIPTFVDGKSQQTIATPDTSYWALTAAHYYVNGPGISAKDACVWGEKTQEKGNWAPYVAGSNMDDKGNTFIKIAWNPKHIDDFSGKTPNFGLRIVCDDPSSCVGAPCEINPLTQGYNGVNSAPGCGGKSLGASYCIVTATKNSKARIEVFEV